MNDYMYIFQTLTYHLRLKGIKFLTYNLQHDRVFRKNERTVVGYFNWALLRLSDFY